MELRHCIRCGRGFYPKDASDDRSLCWEHQKLHQRMREQARTVAERKKALSWRSGLFRAVQWRGYLVGFYEDGYDEGRMCGKLKAKALDVPPQRIPTSLLVDLDHFASGYRPEQVKAMKKAIKRVYNLIADPPKREVAA